MYVSSQIWLDTKCKELLWTPAAVLLRCIDEHLTYQRLGDAMFATLCWDWLCIGGCSLNLPASLPVLPRSFQVRGSWKAQIQDVPQDILLQLLHWPHFLATFLGIVIGKRQERLFSSFDMRVEGGSSCCLWVFSQGLCLRSVGIFLRVSVSTFLPE